MLRISVAGLAVGFALASAAMAQDPNADTRSRVRMIREMAKQGSDSVPAIATYLGDTDWTVRLEAVKALDDISGPRTVEPLTRALRDNDPEVQVRATDGVVNVYLPGYLKTGISGTLQRVGNSVRAKFSDTNDQVIDAYVRVPQDVIEGLGRVAKGGSSMESRANAARALGILRGRAAIPELIEALHSKDNQVMYEGLIALQKIGDPSAAPRITFLLRDLEEKVQIAALETTGILRDRGSAREVRDALEHARNIKIRRAAVSALGMIADPADRATFARYLTDKDDALRAAGAEGLGRVNNPADRPLLEKAFMDEHNVSPRLSMAFGAALLGNLDTSEFSPYRYLIKGLNLRTYRNVAIALLTELMRQAPPRQAAYLLMNTAGRDEKTGLAIVLARSGDKDSLAPLEALSKDTDPEVAQEGIRDLRSLKARLP
ncbi:MAG TPA: HEAT repeat domain-containing protein [Bryobacteraceae bacterium]|nr:HEAT repeat domain-containing protein [Bryobacteraceae bacterium]